MDTNIKVLYENENYLVLNKPAGLMVHSDGKVKEKTLVDWVLENYPGMENVGEPFFQDSKFQIPNSSSRCGIAHRLDKETSGVIALAKNQKAYEYLKAQFKKREIKKIYKAFVYGVLKDDKGVIDKEIGRSSKFGLWSSGRGLRGKVREAVTEYEVLERGKDFSFLKVMPKTGRTHQIRVHMKYINHPVLCDSLYAPKRECLLGFERLALHAESLEFEELGGGRILVEAPLPEDFERALEALK